MVALIVFGAGMVMAVPGSSPAGDKPSGWLTPDKIRKSTLKAVFEKQEGWKVEKIDDGLKVFDNEGRLAEVLWDDDKELICYIMYYAFKPEVSAKKKRKLANEINDSVVFTKAMIDKEGDLRFEYWLRFGAGLSEGQVMDSVNYFIKTTTGALDWKDTRDLVK